VWCLWVFGLKLACCCVLWFLRFVWFPVFGVGFGYFSVFGLFGVWVDMVQSFTDLVGFAGTCGFV